jgi:hypothetical protein
MNNDEEYKRISLDISLESYEILKQITKEEKVLMSELIEKALKLYVFLRKQFNHE